MTHRMVLGAGVVALALIPARAPGAEAQRPAERAPDGQVEKPLVPVPPDWLDGAMDYQLPAWYDDHRVHAHTRLGPPYFDKDVFLNAAQGFKEMGVSVFTRHIKSGCEGAWWPSAVGAVHPAAVNRNLAKEIIDSAHREGLRIIVYHRHMEDEWAVQQHPDWAARDWKGRIYEQRGPKACFNSPYADFVLTRMLELVDMGADGFYFDEVHMPRPGCWCPYCKKGFKEETGLDHPPSPDPANPVWQKLKDFNNLSIERTFLKWRMAIHERNPEVVMVVGSNTWPCTNDRQMTNRLFRIADSVKTEFSLPARTISNAVLPMPNTMKPVERDAKIALGYTLARDAADGRPAHVWTYGLLDENSTLYATSGIVTHGCIANLDIPEDTIPNMMFQKAFALGDKVSPYFAGTRPVRWAALHYSELARDKCAMDPGKAWSEVLYPLYGAYLSLLRERLPVGIITDSQLEDGLLNGYRILFLPEPMHLTDRMREVVSAFRAGGGLVIENQPSWKWHDPTGGQDDAIKAFLEALRPQRHTAPVVVFGGPEKMHVVSFVTEDNRRLTVSLCNDFSWVYTGRKPSEDETKQLTTTPPSCTGVTVLVRDARTPRRVFNAVRSMALLTKRTAAGLEIELNGFPCMFVLVIEFA